MPLLRTIWKPWPREVRNGTGLLRGLTFLLGALTMAAAVRTRADATDERWLAWLTFALLMAGISWWCDRQNLPRVGKWLFGVVPVMVLVAPLMRRTVDDRHGLQPLDAALLTGCAGAALAMAALATRVRQCRVAAGVSVFVILLASLQLDRTTAAPLLSGYAAAGCLFLCVDRVGPASLARSLSSLAVVAVATGLTIGCQHWSGSTARETAGVRHGLWPASGGDASPTDAATGGVGDGPDEIAGSKEAKSIGFDQSNVFMNSDRAGLYDAFLETFGAPSKTRDVVKMQMLRVQDIHAAETTNVDDYRAGRQFSLVREAPAATVAATSHAARAMLYVSGTLPLHLRTGAFDRFDGTSWHLAATGWPEWELQATASDATWFGPAKVERLRDGKTQRLAGEAGPSPFEHSQTARVRIGKLPGNALPLPAGVEHVRLGRVTRLALFSWQAPDVLQMNRPSIPTGTVIDAGYDVLNPCLLTPWSWDAASRDSAPVADDIARLARQWTAGVPFGWGQIAAITDRLRRDDVFDRGFRSGERRRGFVAHPVADFLLRDRRGPDYLFASAAALMLRSLGYSTRLASGFYADETTVDPRTNEAALNARHLHFWAEVQLAGRWAVIEATPGYFTDAVVRSPWIVRLNGLWRAVRSHGLLLGCLAAGLAVTWLNRVFLLDRLATTSVRCRAAEDVLLHAQRTALLVDRRATLAGVRRPAAMTFQRWVTTSPILEDQTGATERLAEFAAWSAYGSMHPSPWSAGEVRRVCDDVRRGVTARRLRRSRLRLNRPGGDRT